MSRHRDRISALPDEILCRILSFLPTKHAVATTLISKRWKSLWHSVPTLHFDDRDFPNHTRFLHFVYAVLLFRDTSSPVRDFRLKCSCSDVSVWVQAAVQRGVESFELEILHRCPLGFKLPSALLNCGTLTDLALKETRLDSLPYVDLPRLKTLRLENVFFDCDGSIMKLLSGCPVLEDLLTDGLFARNHNREKDGEVKCLLNLVRADICTLYLQLTLFGRVEFLRVNLVNFDKNNVPTFHNLTHMEFCITLNMYWKWLVAMLEHCPKLQNLVLHKQTLHHCSSRNLYLDNWEDPQVVPEGVSSQLRTCSFRNYGGVECELQFARYIMQNSRFLRTMTVEVLYGCSKLGPQQTLDMARKLSMCPGISAACKLSLESSRPAMCTCVFNHC